MDANKQNCHISAARSILCDFLVLFSWNQTPSYCLSGRGRTPRMLSSEACLEISLKKKKKTAQYESVRPFDRSFPKPRRNNAGGGGVFTANSDDTHHEVTVSAALPRNATRTLPACGYQFACADSSSLEDRVRLPVGVMYVSSSLWKTFPPPPTGVDHVS